MRAVIALVALLPLALAARVFNTHPSHLRAAARQAERDDVPRVPPQFNINSGGPDVGRFVADADPWIVGNTNILDLENAIIGGAEDKNRPMYKSHRFGVDGATWGYDIPVMEPGIYGCTAHFAETESTAFRNRARVFDLHLATAEGPVRDFKRIDVFAELDGAEFTVLTRTAEHLVVTGILSLRVKSRVGNPMLSGLTCERTADLPPSVKPDFDTDPIIPVAPVMDTESDLEDSSSPPSGVAVSGTEVNINCGGPAVGRFSAEDYSWIKGKTSQWEGPPGVVIGGSEEKNTPAVKSHRYGKYADDWGYVIPLENPGIYECSLHFSETDSDAFSVGARLFDVMVMDQVATDVDAFSDAGMSPFTSSVKTFVDLAIPESLMISFKAKAGDAFVSAITCEKTGDLSPSELTPEVSALPDTEVSQEPSPMATEVEFSSIPTPTPFESTETPIASPVFEPADPPSETPSVVTETPDSDSESDEPAAPTESSDVDALSITLDPLLEQQEGTFLQRYELRALVENGEFTEEVKDALLAVSTDSMDSPSTFALVALRREDGSQGGEGEGEGEGEGDTTVRQDSSSDASYLVDLHARHEDDDERETVDNYTEFITDGDVNERLSEKGIENVQVSLVQAPRLNAEPSPEEASTTSTSVIIGVTIGCVIVGFVVAAVIAFAVNRKRNNERSAGGFDAPPPALSESDASSVLERSETGASVEYLDDDSTFTAATSRGGDPVDQVGFVKDVFGRGVGEGSQAPSS